MAAPTWAFPAALASSAIVVVSSSGLMLLGLLLAGGLLASWGYVYSHTVCAAEPFVWSQMMRTAAVGALGMPTIAVIAWLAGPGVWLLVGCAAWVWVLLVTRDGRVALPGQVRKWLRDVPMDAWRLLRGTPSQCTRHDRTGIARRRLSDDSEWRGAGPAHAGLSGLVAYGATVSRRPPSPGHCGALRGQPGPGSLLER